MQTVFDVIRLIKINHNPIDSHHLVITDRSGKPDAILTGLSRDVLEKINIFMTLDNETTVDDILTMLTQCTPLPEDVLSEYEKILTETVLAINIATKKDIIEIVVNRPSY